MEEKYIRLIGAVLIQAVKDWKNEKNRPDILDFLKSDKGETWAQALGFDPSDIREQLETDAFQRVNIRAAYR